MLTISLLKTFKNILVTSRLKIIQLAYLLGDQPCHQCLHNICILNFLFNPEFQKKISELKLKKSQGVKPYQANSFVGSIFSLKNHKKK